MVALSGVPSEMHISYIVGFIHYMIYSGLQTNFFHQEHRDLLLKMLGAQTEILGAHNQWGFYSGCVYMDRLFPF